MERIRRHLSYANVAATLALVFAMSGGAIAATGGFSSGGTLRACANEEGAIRLLKPGKKCKKGQTAVAWNQAGPAGARGSAGAPGATGAAGAAGPAGAKGADGAKGAEGIEGEGATVSWAQARETGEIQAASGVGSVTQKLGGYFEVEFEENVNNCAVTATPDEGAEGITVTARPEGHNVKVYMSYKDAPIFTGFSIVATCF